MIALIETFFNNISDIALLLDIKEKRIVLASEGAKTAYPKLVELPLEISSPSLVPDVYSEEVLELLKEDKIIENKYNFKDKSYLISILPIESGNFGLITIKSKSIKSIIKHLDLETISENSIDLISKISLSGKVIYATPNYYTLLGYGKDEVINKHISKFILPEDYKQIIKNKKLFFENSLIEFRLRKKNGELIWVESKNKPLVNNNDSEERSVLSIARNITIYKRKEAIYETRLRLIKFAESNSLSALLKKTLDEAEILTNSKIGFYHFVNEDQQNLTLQEWSTNTENLFCKRNFDFHTYNIAQAGVWVDCFYAKAPVIHNDYENMGHKKGLPEGHAVVVRELVVPVKRRNKVVAILGVGNKPNNYDEDDISVISLLADLAWEIAEKKIAEQKLIESEKKLQNIFSIAPVGLAIVKNRKFLEMNSAFCKMVGYESQELINQDSKMLYSNYEEYLHVGETDKLPKSKLGFIIAETNWIKKDKSIIEVFIRGIKIEDNSKGTTLVISVVDNTERNENERELKKANAEKDKFFSIIAHDLKNPFQGFLGMSQLLAENYDDLTDDDVREISQEIRGSAKTLYTLLENLLNWSRVKRGMVITDFVNINLNYVINESVVLFEKNAMLKQQKICVEINDDIMVNIDLNLFNSIIRNLISNAIKFSFQGGIIKVVAKSFNDEKILISVIDEGIGCNDNELSRLFSLEGKVSKRGTADEPSSGLGLILCKEYVEKLKGTIWAEKNKDKGTIFNFTIEKGE